MRDDFPPSVKQVIAQRVGHRCSNPTCGASTSGPQRNPAKAINLGVAAHITAAAPGGPRYRSKASPQDRKSPENGIWLCQNCAKLIDNDVQRFTESLLRHWKKNAEDRASRELGQQSPFDRSDTPDLEILPSSIRRWAIPMKEPFSPGTVRQLLDALPEEFRAPEQVEMLGSGFDILGQQYGIVGAGINHGWDWIVGLFTGSDLGWQRIANIQLEGQKAWTPEASYVRGAPGALVVTHVHGYGTGVFRRSTSWYRISKDEPFPFLSYPREFHVVGWGMPFGRKLTSTTEIMPKELIDGAHLQLRFDVTYTMEDQPGVDGAANQLLVSSERLSLEWSETAGVFMPRSAADDFARIEEIWSEGTEGFAKRNAERLRELAEHGTPGQRIFVRRHFAL